MVADRLRAIARVPRASVRVRTVLVAVAVVGVALAVGAVGLVSVLHAMLMRDLRAATTVQATDLARSAAEGTDPVAATAANDDLVVQVLGPDGTVLAATAAAAGLPPLMPPEPGQWRTVDVPFDDDPFLAVAAAVTGGRTILLGRSLDTVSATTRTVAALLVAGLPALLLVVAATTWRVVGRALAPVEAIRCEVDAMSASRLHRRVPLPPGQDEITRLAHTMNRMLDRLESAQLRQRRFIGDASHELRSPVATIRQHAEVAIVHPDRVTVADLAGTVHAESLRLQALVDALLLLARADEHRLSPRSRPLDLDDLVITEVRRLRQMGSAEIDGSGIAAVRIDGDPALLPRLLRNLGDNAARHARGQIAVTLFEEAGWATVHIDDDGAGIPDVDRSRVFHRFVRLDESRQRDAGGSGLGLAIVAEIAAAHGGEVVVTASPLGGARLTVHLPARPD